MGTIDVTEAPTKDELHRASEKIEQPLPIRKRDLDRLTLQIHQRMVHVIDTEGRSGSFLSRQDLIDVLVQERHQRIGKRKWGGGNGQSLVDRRGSTESGTYD